MATVAELEDALRNADASGDVDAAQRLADALSTARSAPSLDHAPDQPVMDQALAGYRAGISGIGRNIGIPFTDIDLAHAMEWAGAPTYEQLNAKAEAAGGAAPYSRFATEVIASLLPGAKAGQATAKGINALKSAPSWLKSSAVPVAAAEGATAAALTGQGDPLEDIAKGAAGGVAGQKVASGVGKVLTGARGISDDAATLLEEGIPLTPGQAMSDTTMAGKVVRGIEEASTSIPIVGTIVENIRATGTEALRGRALKVALPPGMKLPKEAGRQPLKALSAIGDEFSHRYDSVLDKVKGKLPPVHPQGGDYLIRKAFDPAVDPDAFITPLRMEHVTKRITNAVNDNGKGFTARQLFKVQSDLRTSARKLLKGGSGDTRGAITLEDISVADGYNRAADEILKGLERVIPGGNELQALRAPYKAYATLRHELEKFKGFGETATPTAIRKAAKAMGDKDLERIARTGETLLPSRTPDSGTAKRAAAMMLTGGVGGAGYGVATGQNPLETAAIGAGVLAPAALSTTKLGSRAVYGQLPGQKSLAEILKIIGAASGGVYAP